MAPAQRSFLLHLKFTGGWIFLLHLLIFIKVEPILFCIMEWPRYVLLRPFIYMFKVHHHTHLRWWNGAPATIQQPLARSLRWWVSRRTPSPWIKMTMRLIPSCNPPFEPNPGHNQTMMTTMMRRPCLRAWRGDWRFHFTLPAEIKSQIFRYRKLVKSQLFICNKLFHFIQIFR